MMGGHETQVSQVSSLRTTSREIKNMTTATATAPVAIAEQNWKNYELGTYVRGHDGKVWRIVEISTRRSQRGYQVREFVLRNEKGREIRKTSRGITLLVSGRRVRRRRKIAPVRQLLPVAPTVAPTVAQEPEQVEVKDNVIRHAQYPALLAAVTGRNSVWLVGPKGTGKSTAAANVAEDLGLKFYPISFGAQTSEAKLLGYNDATGKVVRTPLREAFEHGGVVLFDELDGASPGVLVVLNACLANDTVGFPDGPVQKHKDFVVIAGANTYGRGGNRAYNGRQQIDDATLDRFIFLKWETDARIIAVKAGVPLSALSAIPAPSAVSLVNYSPETCEEAATSFATFTAKIIAAIAKSGDSSRFDVGSRSIIIGVSLVRHGYSVDDALDACVWRGIDDNIKVRVEAAALAA